ncbi:MAG: hypothetical protein AAFO82_13130, partial [Bacteroidota bacterium]
MGEGTKNLEKELNKKILPLNHLTIKSLLDLFDKPSNGCKRQISSCIALKSLVNAKALPVFFALHKIKFAALSLVHDPPNKSIVFYLFQHFRFLSTLRLILD